jgi:hypothetical protein
MRGTVRGSSGTVCAPLHDSARFTFKLHVLLKRAHFDLSLVTCRLLIHQQTKVITSPCHTKLTISLTKNFVPQAYNITS